MVVLDFQSLYPSIMIAHNMCYSTCLGNVDEGWHSIGKRIGMLRAAPDFDFLGLDASEDQIRSKIFVAPNRVAFLRREVQEGVIPRLLSDFLRTRIMFKDSAKLYPHSRLIQRVLDYRQTALKLFMNVMYGYTGASGTGRMPCCDIADSIVGTGRHLMQKCIAMIDQMPGLKVIYGDTDSLFILAKGFSYQAAERAAKDITKRVTKMLPHPMELKFEKVMQPFAALAKKRYCGIVKGNFMAKGIEVVRRDGCPALVKIFREVANMSMKSKDLSELKKFLQDSWVKLDHDAVNIQDLLFAKAVKLGHYKQMPAWGYAAEMRGKFDPMLKALYKERVKYLVVSNPDSKKLKDSVIPVEVFMAECHMPINSLYYNENILNKALGRFLKTLNISVDRWFDQRQQLRDRSAVLSFDELMVYKAQDGGTNKPSHSLKLFTKAVFCLICKQPNKSTVVSSQPALRCLQAKERKPGHAARTHRRARSL